MSQAVVFHWPRHYHVPTLGLWGLVLLLIVLPKANRRPQAWLILIPLGLVAMVWQMPARLVSLPASATESLGFVVVTGALGWAAIWLLGDWLARQNGLVAFLVAMAVLWGIGAVSCALHFGLEPGEDSALLIPYGLSALVLVSALVLARKFSGGRFRRGRLMGWQFLSIGLVASGVFVPYFVIVLAVVLGEPHKVLLAVIQILVVLPMAAAVWTVLTYLFNLPFMLLVFNSPFFLKRFQAVFGFEEGDRQEECRSPNSRRGCPFMAQDAIPVLGQKR